MNSDYQETIAKYLARKENFSYALEVAAALEDAKKLLRRNFWDAFQQLCGDYIREQGRDLKLSVQPGKGDTHAIEELWIGPKGNQPFSLCYAWQDEGDVAFGLRYSRERYVNGSDLFAGIAGMDGFREKLMQPLPKGEPNNPTWMCWRFKLGNLYQDPDLTRMAEDPLAYAERIFDPFKALDMEFHQEFIDINRQLATLEAPAEIGR